RPQTTAPAGPHDTLTPARPRRPRCSPPSVRASPCCPAHRPPPTPPRPAPPHHNPPAPRSPRYRHRSPARPLPAPCGNLRERFLVHEGGFGHRQREREAGTLDTATAERTADEERAGRRSGEIGRASCRESIQQYDISPIIIYKQPFSIHCMYHIQQ